MPARRRRRPLGWWSPDPRGVLPLDGLRVSRSLRRSLPPLRRHGRHRVRRGGRRAAPTPRVRAAGSRRRSARPTGGCTSSAWAHSRRGPGRRRAPRRRAVRRLASAGCSPGSRCSTAATRRLEGRRSSRWSTCCAPTASRGRLLDVQWCTPHLATLGVVEVPREDYLRRLAGRGSRCPPLRLGAPRRHGVRRCGAPGSRPRAVGTLRSRHEARGRACAHQAGTSVAAAGSSDDQRRRARRPGRRDAGGPAR